MKIWVLVGYTNDVGLWDTEVFTTKIDAIAALQQYAEDYDADISGFDAICDEGSFHIEEHEI